MYQYYFENCYTGDEWIVTGCNCKEDALEYMQEHFGGESEGWEYKFRKPMATMVISRSEIEKLNAAAK